MTPSNIEDYVLLAKVGLKNLEIIIELLKAINFKEVLTGCVLMLKYICVFL